MCAVITPRASKPVGVRCRLTKLRIKSPAVATSATENATSSTTRATRARSTPAPAEAPRPPRSEPLTLTRTVRHAGTTPKRTAVTAETAAVDAQTCESISMRNCSAIGNERVEQPNGDDRNAGPCEAGTRAQEEALDQQLTHDHRAAGTERDANRHLANARGRPREEEIGDVDAAKQQHEADAADEQHQIRPPLPHLGVAQCHHDRPSVAVGDRMVLLHPRGDPCEVRLLLSHRDARPQASDDGAAATRGHPLRVDTGRNRDAAGYRNPDVGRIRKAKSLRHDTDNRIHRRREVERLLEDVGPAARRGLPQVMTDERLVRGDPGASLLGPKQSPDRGIDAEDGEQFRRGPRHAHRFGRTVAAKLRLNGT